MKLTAAIYPDEETHGLVAGCPGIGTSPQVATGAELTAKLRAGSDLDLEAFPGTPKNPTLIHSIEVAYAFGNDYE